MYPDPRLRCSRCGRRLETEPANRCDGCGADLAEVGTWSERAEWNRTRRQGRWRFALKRGLLFCPAVPLLWAVNGYRGETVPAAYALDLKWPVIGFVAGWPGWWWAEREYAAAGRRDGAT
ncbi:MAG: hypothetical protein K2X87_11230 [Gemmataceae bacterium]|nr:hypothetical protein [Gemmataceae bacterium]